MTSFRHHHSPPPHTHPEHPDPQKRLRAFSRLKATYFVAVSLFLISVTGSILSGSLALLADAFHTLADLLALSLTLGAAWMATTLRSRKRSFGYYRLEILAALLNGLLVLVMGIFILHEAWKRLEQAREIEGPLMLGFAIFGLAANLFMLWLLKREQTKNLNVQGAFLHILGDTMASVAVIGGAFLITLTGHVWIDSLASALVAMIISIMAFRLIWDSTKVLLEGAPDHMDPNEVEKLLKKEFPEIVDIHDFHIWEITSHLFAMTAHIRAKVHSLEDTKKLIDRINALIRSEYGLGHTTFQVEPETAEDSSATE